MEAVCSADFVLTRQYPILMAAQGGQSEHYKAESRFNRALLAGLPIWPGIADSTVPTGRSQLNINCSPELIARVKARARLEGVTVTELVTRLIEEVLHGDGADLSAADRFAAIEKRLDLLEAAVR
jgi:hypothetical protein